MNPLLLLSNIYKSFASSGAVLTDLTLAVETGESLAILGASGSGKSTLLNLISGLDFPDSGSIQLMGLELDSLSAKQWAEVRRDRIGFIFQAHHLLPQCTALENVLIPSLVKKADARDRAVELLQRVGLEARMNHRPSELSGGECQRVAVARALINQPALILADEPTGALNRAGSDMLMELLLELNELDRTTLLMVTHSERLALRMDRSVTLKNGQFS